MDIEGNYAAASFRDLPPPPAPWTPLQRVLFRIAFLYFFCFILLSGNGTIFSIFPIAGDWLEGKLDWPMNHLAEWTGQHVFHLTGLAATWHPTGSGDTALNWIINGLFLLFALAGGLLWSLIAALRGSRRTEYRTLHAWLRFLLRLTCGFFMLNYGIDKLFPLQMAPISIAILNEPVGHLSPMTLLWSLIGFNPVYEMICGAAEVLGGVLLLFRRTALLGALISAFVISNVVLYNFFFDVPVKLFALVLLLALLYLMLPDLRAMFEFFWLHRPAAPTAGWAPPAKRKMSRLAIGAVESIFTIAFLVVFPMLTGIGWRKYRAEARIATPLLGAWRLDAAHPASGAFVTPEGRPATDLYIDTAVRAFVRSTDEELWRTNLHLDAKAHTVQIQCYLQPPVTYEWRMPDPDHLMLTSVAPPKAQGKQAPAFSPAVVSLTRVPVPAHYPLLERGFHFVNQWGLER